MADKDTRLFLLDGMALVYRAHFALMRNPRITSTGFNASAVMGYMNTLLEILTKRRPTHLAVAFDTSEPTFRHEEYKEYKAQRDKMPEDLAAALPYVFKLTEAMNIPVLRYPGFEADDVIGTLAREATARGLETFMVTPDKDYAQLVSDTVKILKPSKDGIVELDKAKILEEWGIERVDQVIDVLGLMGDASDNIPGVPGIGPKTAQKLIAEYGSLEEILKNTDKLKGKQKERFEENSELAILSKRLVTIDTEVELKHCIDDLKLQEPNKDALVPLLAELELNALGKRLLGDDFDGSSRNNMGELKTMKDVDHDYQVVDTEAKIKKLVTQLQKQDAFCFDLETTSLETHEADIVGISFAWKAGKAFYVPFQETGLFGSMELEHFKPLFENPDIGKIGHNLKFDISVLRYKGVVVRGKIFDTMLAHYLIDPDDTRKLDYLAQKYLSYDPVSYDSLTDKGQRLLPLIPVEEVADYCCEDSDVSIQLKAILEPMLKEKGVEQVFTFECDLVTVLVDMEFQGIRVDVRALKQYGQELQEDILGYEERIYELAGRTFNIGSPKQIGEIFFDVLKLEENPKKTKTGQYKTDEKVLERLAVNHPIAHEILDYRQVSKLKNTYVDQLPKAARNDRVHTTFSQAVTVTGRMASSNPNLQNIPIRTSRGREIRKAFIPTPGHKLLSADYSQIELRIIAEFAQAEKLIEAFEAGLDIHTATASHVFGVELESVTKEMRSRSKMVNYGLAYGMSAFGLSQRLNISRYEAKEIIDQYFAAFPGIQRYMDDTIESAREKGYVETMLGRRRYLRDINSRNGNVRQGAERNAINMPIQGTSADMIKIAMVNVARALDEGGYKTKMLLQIHDELVFDLVPDEEAEVRDLVRELMVSAIPMRVPIEVDMGVGDNWLQAH